MSVGRDPYIPPIKASEGMLTDPATGEILTPDVLSQRILNTVTELESDAIELQSLIVQQARYAALYLDACDTGAKASDARASADRERDGRIFARSKTLPGDTLNLEAKKMRIDGMVKMHREHEHTLRSMLSALQTTARTMGIVVGG